MAVSIGVAASPVLDYTIVYGNAGLSISSPAIVTLACSSARTCAGTDGLIRNGREIDKTRIIMTV